jgi:hypothetical protein
MTLDPTSRNEAAVARVLAILASDQHVPDPGTARLGRIADRVAGSLGGPAAPSEEGQAMRWLPLALGGFVGVAATAALLLLQLASRAPQEPSPAAAATGVATGPVGQPERAAPGAAGLVAPAPVPARQPSPSVEERPATTGPDREVAAPAGELVTSTADPPEAIAAPAPRSNPPARRPRSAEAAPASSAVAPSAASGERDRRLAQVQALRRQGRAAEAAAALEPLLTSHGDELEAEWIGLAELQLEALSRPVRAVEVLDRYLARRRPPLLRELALARRVEALQRAGRLEQALKASTAFLAAHGSSDQRGDVLLVTGHVLRQLGRIGEAARAFRGAAGSKTLAHARRDEAAFYSAETALRAGQRAEARRELAEYLIQHPQGRYRQAVQALLERR